MEVEEKIVKRNGDYFVMSDDGKKKLGGPFKTREQAVKRLQQVEHFKTKESFLWEVSNFDIIETEGKSDILEVRGTALEVGKSKNNRNYNFKNLQENDGKSFNWLVGHREDYDNPEHNVGEGTLALEGNKLGFNGRIINSKRYPDIIRQVKEGLVGPSIQGYGDVQMVKEDSKVSFNIENLRIPLISLVNKHVQGVEAANIEAAIAESFKSEVEEVDNKEKENIGEKNMAEEKELEKLQEALKAKEGEIKALKESQMKSERDAIVDSIVEVNESFKDSKELSEKSIEELKIVLEYEKKIKEKEDKKSEEEKKKKKEEDEEEGISQVKGDNKEKPEESMNDIKYDKKTGVIEMSDKMYDKYNKDIMESIYR